MLRLVALVTLGLFAAACTENAYTGERQMSKTAIGAGAGAVGGAAIGALVSQNKGGNALARGALIGGGVGALAGGAGGYYMDHQEAKLREKLRGTGVGVSRQGDTIRLVMPSNVTFDTNRWEILPKFEPILESVALVLEEYDDTAVKITGHTDNVGADQANQTLSERRADSVANALAHDGVERMRFQISGAGERQPVADNATPTGREQNRRVEIEISPKA